MDPTRTTLTTKVNNVYPQHVSIRLSNAQHTTTYDLYCRHTLRPQNTDDPNPESDSLCVYPFYDQLICQIATDPTGAASHEVVVQRPSFTTKRQRAFVSFVLKWSGSNTAVAAQSDYIFIHSRIPKSIAEELRSVPVVTKWEPLLSIIDQYQPYQPLGSPMNNFQLPDARVPIEGMGHFLLSHPELGNNNQRTSPDNGNDDTRARYYKEKMESMKQKYELEIRHLKDQVASLTQEVSHLRSQLVASPNDQMEDDVQEEKKRPSSLFKLGIEFMHSNSTE